MAADISSQIEASLLKFYLLPHNVMSCARGLH
jgi:hypothetical protein